MFHRFPTTAALHTVVHLNGCTEHALNFQLWEEKTCVRLWLRVRAEWRRMVHFSLLGFCCDDGLFEFSCAQWGHPDCEVQSLASEANPVRASLSPLFVLKKNCVRKENCGVLSFLCYNKFSKFTLPLISSFVFLKRPVLKTEHSKLTFRFQQRVNYTCSNPLNDNREIQKWGYEITVY